MSRKAKSQDSTLQRKTSLIGSAKINRYELIPSRIFLEQFDRLSFRAQKNLEQKLLLLKNNPHRNKRIHYPGLFLFRIRFEDNGKEKRAVYLLDSMTVKILFILDRSNNYKDLGEYLERTSAK